MEEKILARSLKYKVLNIPQMSRKKTVLVAIASWVLFMVLINVIGFSLFGVLVMGAALYFIKLCEITVTDKRIYGKAFFGKRFDLPIESVLSVSTLPVIKSVSVITSSGKISLFGIKNADEICSVINGLLADIKNGKSVVSEPEYAAETVTESKSEKFDQLKEYKNLLAQGIITQAEFDALESVGYDNCGYDCRCDDEEEETFEVACPTCGAIINVNESTVEKGNINCPMCGDKFEFEVEYEDDEN